MKTILFSVIIAVSSYLLGSISTGLIIARLQGVDLHKVGSKNTGATNAMRVLGTKSGLITYAGDFLKAAASMTIALLLLPGATFGIPKFGLLLSGLFTILGHNWPIYYGFKGGKGVTCSSAIILFVNPLIGAISIVSFFLTAVLTKYVSLGSLVMLAVNLILTVILHSNEPYTIAFAAIVLLLSLLRHQTNIRRLLNGTENKFGQKKTANGENQAK